MKDFESLKMKNHTQYQDPILESFLEKAREMEEAAGSPDVPETKRQQPVDKAQKPKFDPFRFYTFSDFNRSQRSTLQRQSSSKKSCLKCSLQPETAADQNTAAEESKRLPSIVSTHHRQLSQPSKISSASNFQAPKLAPPISTAHTAQRRTDYGFHQAARGIFTPVQPAGKIETPSDLPEVQEGRMQHLQPKAMYQTSRTFMY